MKSSGVSQQSEKLLSRKDLIQKIISFFSIKRVLIPAFFSSILYFIHRSFEVFLKTKISERIIEVKISSIEEGVNIFPDFLASKKGDRIMFLSNICTHLGCKIQKKEEMEYVCHCHGSRFSIDGSVLKGPANRPLPELSHSLDEASNVYSIRLRNNNE